MLKFTSLRVKTTCIWSLERNREKFDLLSIIRETSLERGLHYEIDSQKGRIQVKYYLHIRYFVK